MSEGMDPPKRGFQMAPTKKRAVESLKSSCLASLVFELPCPRNAGSAAQEIIGQSVIELILSSRDRKHDNEGVLYP